MNNELSYSELRVKRVINVQDGKNLGRIIDMVFNCNGVVLGIVVPNERALLKTVVNGESIFIPWRNIMKIGKDTILVNMNVLIPTGEC